VRDGVFLEQVVIPHVGDMYPTESGSRTPWAKLAKLSLSSSSLLSSPPPVPKEPVLNAYSTTS
jgi:hypothetical protein